MGEQFIDLFAAGAYALEGRIYAALANPALSWLFYIAATAGLVHALIESAVEQRPDLWLRQLAAAGLASILTLMPQQIDLTTLTYGAPGRIEAAFNTQTGAAPHLTYWIERLGANAAVGLRALTHQQPTLAVPGVAAQVAQLAEDPATLNDPQLKANLEIWRRRIVPQLLQDHPDLAQRIRDAGLGEALLDPRPVAAQFVGAAAAAQAQAVQSALAAQGIDPGSVLMRQGPMLNQIAQDAGAQPWIPGAASPSQIGFSLRAPSTPAAASGNAPAGYDDALTRGSTVAAEMQAQLPQGSSIVSVSGLDQLYDLLGRSVLYNAGVTLAHNSSALATVGSLCQRAGEMACRGAWSALPETSVRLKVSEADRYNTGGWTTWVEQPIATTMLAITSLLLSSLSALVVAVLPFALGIAKAVAIIISMLGTWMLLVPGRARIALSWMTAPIAFVSVWSVLFNIWADIEPALSQIAGIVGGSDHGSWSAGRAMSIAISLGYMGLPSLALGIVYGESGRALYHASARLETALLMAWHTRGSIVAFGRRWLVNSPMARRWNQRAYRAVGMGPLRAQRSASQAKRPAPSSTTAAGSAQATALRAHAPTKAKRSTPPAKKASRDAS